MIAAKPAPTVDNQLDLIAGGRILKPMKISIEIDLTPEELRRFMGLPEIQGLQKQMLERFTERLQSSQSQQEEFLKTIFGGAMAPWQRFFNPPESPSEKSEQLEQPGSLDT